MKIFLNKNPKLLGVIRKRCGHIARGESPTWRVVMEAILVPKYNILSFGSQRQVNYISYFHVILFGDVTTTHQVR